jgi:7,8-dihydropterin-6-yl-methyl-4-(beta-D-ribofuranosyl)aminobenzene 5'-phosphate synthase
MENTIDRREFLKLTALVGGGILVNNFAATSGYSQTSFKFQQCDKTVITVITDNLADATRLDYKIANRHKGTAAVVDRALHAEHGLSYHVETIVDGQSHEFLFDFASEIQGVRRNIDLLKINFKKIEALALSHDHWDHQAALVELLTQKRGDLAHGIPLYVGEQFFVGTYAKTPDGQIRSLLSLKKEDVDGLKLVKIVETKTPTTVVPGAFLTGRVEQITEYEKISPSFVAKRGDQYVQEEFLGEQAIFLNIKGKGLVILSGCAHRGIVNTVKHVQKVSGIDKVHAIIGGFHLTNAKPELIQKTITDIKKINPDYIVPAHCTGFEAISEFAREMPSQFILNTAGTRYTITS